MGPRAAAHGMETAFKILKHKSVRENESIIQNFNISARKTDVKKFRKIEYILQNFLTFSGKILMF